MSEAQRAVRHGDLLASFHLHPPHAFCGIEAENCALLSFEIFVGATFRRGDVAHGALVEP